MGIRKHFEKKPDELKLQDLSLETEEPEVLVFDPEEEVTKRDWEIICQDLTLNSVEGCLDEYALSDSVVDHRPYSPPSERTVRKKYLELLGLLKIWSDRFLDFELTDEEIHEAENSDLIFRQDITERLKSMSKEEKQELRENIEKLSDNPRDWGIPIGEHKIITYYNLHYLKIYAPEVIKDTEIPIRASNFFIQEFKEALKDIRQEKRKHISRYALGNIERLFKAGFVLKILAAKKAEMTDHGLKLTMPTPDFKQQKKPRPERKQF